MDQKKSNRKKPVAKPESTQLALPFADPPAPTSPPLQSLATAIQPDVVDAVVVVTTTRLPAQQTIPMQSEVVANSRDHYPPWSDGQREHDFLVHTADKYETRMFVAMKTFLSASGLVVAVNVFGPAVQEYLRRKDIPAFDDRLLSGFFGLAALLLFGAMAFFFARYRQYNPQLSLNVLPRDGVAVTVARAFAVTLITVWWCGLALVVALVLYLCASDILFLIDYIAWNVQPQDWEKNTETKPALR